MARVDDVVYLKHVYEASGFGSPPFCTGIQCKLASNGSPTAAQVSTFATGARLAWNDNMAPIINNTATQGTMELYFQSGGVVTESSSGIDDGGQASQPDAPGASARFVKRHARGPGQRFGSFYTPLLPTLWTENTGNINSAGDTALGTAAANYRADIELIDSGIWVICQVPTDATTIADTRTVTLIEPPSSVSYLNRRYR